MVRYLTHNEVDRKKWDICIENACFETLYPYSWYLDIVSEKWDALVDEDYRSVFPLTWKRKYGVFYLVQPRLTQQLGVFAREMVPANITRLFLGEIPSKFKHIDINLNSSNEMKENDYKVYRRANYELDLNRPLKEIKSNYATNTKRNLKQAYRNDLVIKNIDLETYIALKREADKTGLPETFYKELKKLIKEILNRQAGEIVCAFGKDKPCAAIFWASSRTRMIYLNAASNETGKYRKAMFLLIDDYIKNHAGQSCIIDFEGSNIPGIARFFAGFGAQKKEYLNVQKPAFSLNLKILNRP